MSEKSKLNEYKTVLETSGKFYYKAIMLMLMQKLPKSKVLCLFANYMKSIIEKGRKFELKHLLFIVNEIKPINMTDQEIQ